MNWINAKPIDSMIIDIEIETRLAISLPIDFKDFISEYNAAALKNGYIDIEGIGKVPYTRNVNLASNAKVKIDTLLKAVNEEGIRYFPIGGVGNGDYFCIDLVDEAVVLFSHETGEYILAARSFEEFISDLKDLD